MRYTDTRYANLFTVASVLQIQLLQTAYSSTMQVIYRLIYRNFTNIIYKFSVLYECRLYFSLYRRDTVQVYLTQLVLITAANDKATLSFLYCRYDYLQTMPDGTQQTCVCQTIELVKKPGQSLGLYLREGNGVDRSDGVFVSRLAEGEALEKSGSLKPGDEILSVNNVNVTQMSIDDVVVMISIPMRLLLKTRFLKCSVEQNIRPVELLDKPVVVLKQLPREESRESSFTDDGGPLAGTKPLPTSQTSLGAKLRQQESSTLERNSVDKQGVERKLTLSSGKSPAAKPHVPPQRSHSDKWSYTRQIAMHAPRVLDGEGRILEGPNIWPENSPNNVSLQNNIYHQSTLSQTAYLPPPKLQSKLPNPERVARPIAAPAVPDMPMHGGQWLGRESQQQQQQASMFSPRSVMSDSAAMSSEQYTFQDSPYFSSGQTIGAPRSALRQPSAFPLTSMYPSMKSNSLPRRQTGRTIRWRNDVNDGTLPPNVQMQADFSDSDGAVSAPELPASPMALIPPSFPQQRALIFLYVFCCNFLYQLFFYACWRGFHYCL